MLNNEPIGKEEEFRYNKRIKESHRKIQSLKNFIYEDEKEENEEEDEI